MVKWLMTGPFFPAEAEKKQQPQEEQEGGITYRETKSLEQFPEDKQELRKMIDKWLILGKKWESVKFSEMTDRSQGHTAGCSRKVSLE